MKLNSLSPAVLKIVSGISYTVVGSALSQLFLFLSSIPVSRMLGQTVYGQLGVVQGNVVLITLLSTALLSVPAQKFTAQYLNDKAARDFAVRKILRYSWISSVGFMVLGLLYFLFNEDLFVDSESITIILSTGVIVLFNSMNSSQIGIMAGLGEFKQVSMVNIMKGFAGAGLMIVLGYFFGLAGAVSGLAASSVISFLASSAYITRSLASPEVEAPLPVVRLSFKEFSGIAIPSILATLVTTPAMILANTSLAQGENGLNDMAVYNIAFQWRTIILFIPTYINFIFLSHLTACYRTDTRQFKKLLAGNFLSTLAIAGAMVGLLFLFAAEVEKLYSDEFVGVGKAIFVLSFSALLAAMTSIFGNAFAAAGRMWYGFVPNLVWVAVFLWMLLTAHELDAISLSSIYLASYSVLLVVALLAFGIFAARLGKSKPPLQVHG